MGGFYYDSLLLPETKMHFSAKLLLNYRFSALNCLSVEFTLLLF